MKRLSDVLRVRLRDPARLILYGRSARPWAPMRNAPGHYYSTLPSRHDIEQYRRTGRTAPLALPAIDLQLETQIEFLRTLKPLLDTQPFKCEQGETTLRFHRSDNGYFSLADAVILNALLRLFEPRCIIEVGSGWSTAAMLDTFEERHLPELILIEPFPERLFSLLRDDDLTRVVIREERVQDVPADFFDKLGPGDVLFIDSTHVAKLGSDVNYLLFEVLPRLPIGVIVHVHDMFYPFEYPLKWVEQGRGWNETYLLRAFLEFNHSYKILFWADLLRACANDVLRSEYPLLIPDEGGSLWLRKES